MMFSLITLFCVLGAITAPGLIAQSLEERRVERSQQEGV